MGFSISWLAVQTERHGELFKLAEVCPTDEKDEYYESPISGASLQGGWFLLVGKKCDNRLIQAEFLTNVSKLGATLACSIEEHVMYCSASLWNAGSESWSVWHDPQNKGIYDLEYRGKTPDSFVSLRNKIFKKQDEEGGEKADVDLVFDIPLLLASELTGFKHDEDCDCFAQAYPVVFTDQASLRKEGAKRAWWKIW
jgi:hypothetical protein